MADRLDIPQEEADEFIQRYLAGFPAVARFIEETIEQGTEHGYVSTLFGRRRQVRSCARAAGSCASRASGSRSTW